MEVGWDQKRVAREGEMKNAFTITDKMAESEDHLACLYVKG
jgi:hypothetical protein